MPKLVRVQQYVKPPNKLVSMSKISQVNSRTVDVRAMVPHERHSHIFKVFDRMSPGDVLLVINDHEPIHLLQLMKHERGDFDASSYEAYQRQPDEWVAVFKKRDTSAPTQGDGVIVTSFREERNYDNNSFSPVPIYSTDKYKVILTYFRAGQFIPVHAPNIDLVFLVQSGAGEIVAGDARREIGPGDVAIIPKGVRRGIKAHTDMEALHLVSPPPNDANHAEVVEKLQSARFD